MNLYFFYISVYISAGQGWKMHMNGENPMVGIHFKYIMTAEVVLCGWVIVLTSPQKSSLQNLLKGKRYERNIRLLSAQLNLDHTIYIFEKSEFVS